MRAVESYRHRRHGAQAGGSERNSCFNSRSPIKVIFLKIHSKVMISISCKIFVAIRLWNDGEEMRNICGGWERIIQQKGSTILANVITKPTLDMLAMSKCTNGIRESLNFNPRTRQVHRVTRLCTVCSGHIHLSRIEH